MMNSRLTGKQIAVACDLTVSSCDTLQIVRDLLTLNANLTLFSARAISDELETLRRNGEIGISQRRICMGDLKHHLCVAGGSDEFLDDLDTMCAVQCVWLHCIGRPSDVELPFNWSLSLLVETSHSFVEEDVDAPEMERDATLYLVGVGPGTPEMLTLQAYNHIQTAQIVISDRLISPKLLELVPADCKVLYTRKVCGKAHAAQEEINQWIKMYLGAGMHVTRLKCGDPFLFGRGGEEWNYARELGHKVVYIPGVSSSLCAPGVAGISTNSGIPPTMRGVSDQVLIATGTRQNMKSAKVGLYNPSRTVILLMAMKNLDGIADELVNTLMYPPWLPVAVIERATYEDERVLKGTLVTICEQVKQAGVQSHATIVIGNVVETLIPRERPRADSSCSSIESVTTLLGMLPICN